MPRLEIWLWGTPRVHLDGVPIKFDTRKAMALLAYLSMNPDGYRRDSLATFLWPDYDQEHARGALRRTLSTLLSSLESEGSTWLEIDREQLALKKNKDYWMDVDEFRQTIASYRSAVQGDNISRNDIEKCKQAVDLHRGNFLAGFTLRDSPEFDEWQSYQNETLSQELSVAIQQLVSSLILIGELGSAVDYGRKWLALDPLSEEAYRELMKLYYWSGQRNAALKQYQDCTRILDRELGVEPLEETSSLYELILQDKLPDPPKTMDQKSFPVEFPKPQAFIAQPELKPAPLVGRDEEVAHLLQAYSKVNGKGLLAVIEGEPGIGKSRLAQEILPWIIQQGGQVISGRCYEGQAELAYAPIAEALRQAISDNNIHSKLSHIPVHWLAESTRLLPELRGIFPNIPNPSPSIGLGSQMLFFESIKQIIRGITDNGVPGVLYLDDVQWADPGTLEFLLYLVHRLADFPLLILLSGRDREGIHNPSFQRITAAAQKEGRLSRTSLRRLSLIDVKTMVQTSSPLGGILRGITVEQLYEEAEGLPLFVIEYMAAAQVVNQTSENDLAIPETISELIHSRIASVDETSYQLLTTAACIGRSFDFSVLKEASGRSELETVNGLEALIRHGLIHEKPSSVESPEYDFSHDIIRRVLYDQVSLARKKLLHHRIAESLIALSPSRRISKAGLIAYHLNLAGFSKQAADYYVLAGDQAMQVYANDQAIKHFRSAVELGYPDRSACYEKIGDLSVLQGVYNQAVASYQKAIELCDNKCQFSLKHKLGNVYDRRGEWDLAEESFQAAAKGYDAAQMNKAQLFGDWSRLHYHRGEINIAVRLAHESLELAGASNSRLALAQAHNVLGMAFRVQGDFDLAAEHLSQSLEIAENIGDIHSRIAAYNNLAFVSRDCGQLEKAIKLTQSALELSQMIGDRHQEAALLNNLADLHHSAGQPDESMIYLKKAVVIFSQIGSETGSLSPEPWKLVEW